MDRSLFVSALTHAFVMRPPELKRSLPEPVFAEGIACFRHRANLESHEMNILHFAVKTHALQDEVWSRVRLSCVSRDRTMQCYTAAPVVPAPVPIVEENMMATNVPKKKKNKHRRNRKRKAEQMTPANSSSSTTLSRIPTVVTREFEEAVVLLQMDEHIFYFNVLAISKMEVGSVGKDAPVPRKLHGATALSMQLSDGLELVIITERSDLRENLEHIIALQQLAHDYIANEVVIPDPEDTEEVKLTDVVKATTAMHQQWNHFFEGLYNAGTQPAVQICQLHSDKAKDHISLNTDCLNQALAVLHKTTLDEPWLAHALRIDLMQLQDGKDASTTIMSDTRLQSAICISLLERSNKEYEKISDKLLTRLFPVTPAEEESPVLVGNDTGSPFIVDTRISLLETLKVEQDKNIDAQVAQIEQMF